MFFGKETQKRCLLLLLLLFFFFFRFFCGKGGKRAEDMRDSHELGFKSRV